MQIPFTKAHGAKNDFLLTWASDVPAVGLPELARAICNRQTGIGADGWLIVDDRPGIRLFNSDGSEPELSGNGTRCAAAFLVWNGHGSAEFDIATGAGVKHLELLSRNGLLFTFRMNMGRPRVIENRFSLALSTTERDVTLVDCGNPQCAVPVEDFNFDWAAVGAEIESHPQFPHRTNVSFFRATDAHTIEVRFYERGAGETMSSGTGSTGAAAAAIARGLANSPLGVETPAGRLEIQESYGDYLLVGPAVIVGQGTFFSENASE